MELTIDEIRALVQGKFSFRQCLECAGTGVVWVDCDLGVVVSAPDSGQPDYELRYHQEQCESCHGIGGFIQWK